ncbi:MAG: Rnase Y domain-containing protein, partial [Desulfuromonadales bacterium]
MKIELTLLLTFAGLIVGGFIGAIMRARASGSKFANAEREAAQIVENAKKEAETIIKEADIQSKDVVFKAKAAWDDEVREIRRELHAQEKRLVQKEENLDRKVSQADEKEHDLSRREQSLLDRDRNLQKRTEEAEALVAEQRLKLENLSGITAEEAKQQLMTSMESEARHDAAKRIRQIEDEAKEVADKKAKKILSLAIQRFAGDYVAEKTINSVALPSDEMKGRIIGREGRNIRAIEAATGIDLIIDDTPEAVIISGFNPVRREVARLALEKLIADGR